MEKTAAIRVSNSFCSEQLEELQHALDTRERSYKGEPPKVFFDCVKKVNAMRKQVRRKRLEASRGERPVA